MDSPQRARYDFRGVSHLEAASGRPNRLFQGEGGEIQSRGGGLAGGQSHAGTQNQKRQGPSQGTLFTRQPPRSSSALQRKDRRPRTLHDQGNHLVPGGREQLASRGIL